MKEQIPFTEAPIADSLEKIRSFFAEDRALYESFNAVCAHMAGADNAFLVRSNGEIIGLAKAGEHLRFYMMKRSDSYFIKYKNQGESVAFLPENQELFFSMNASCNAYFAENIENLRQKNQKRREKKEQQKEKEPLPIEATDTPAPPLSHYKSIAAEWAKIHEKAARALQAGVFEKAPNTLVNKVYLDLLRLLTLATNDPALLVERERIILLKRTLSLFPSTLQELGDEFGISRERIRQLELRAWKKLINGIHHSKKEAFIPYRNRLKEIIESIPEENLISTVSEIKKENARIGEWLRLTLTDRHTRASFVLP